jgi:hypothetical protein
MNNMKKEEHQKSTGNPDPWINSRTATDEIRTKFPKVGEMSY